MKSFIWMSLLLLSLVATNLEARSPGGHSYPHHSKEVRPVKAKKEKKRNATTPGNPSGSVQVQGYERKDGTYVSPYNRSPPASSVAPATTTRPNTSPLRVQDSQPYRAGHVAAGYTLDPAVHTGMFGKIKRSGAAKDAFKRSQPCPSNGNSHGSCPGYVIDHVGPLECGGADDPSNPRACSVTL